MKIKGSGDSIPKNTEAVEEKRTSSPKKEDKTLYELDVRVDCLEKKPNTQAATCTTMTAHCPPPSTNCTHRRC